MKTFKKSFPKYNVKLSSGKKVSFRPFTVREEQSLLIAKQTDNNNDILSTLIQIVSDCYEEDAKEYSISDFETAFLYLRAKSVGEIEKATIVCPYTGEQVKVIVDCINDIQVKGKKQSNSLKLDDCVLKLKEITVKELLLNPDYNKTYEDKISFIANSIICIEKNEEIINSSDISLEDRILFLNNLTPKEFKKIIEYFDNTSKLFFNLQYKTKNGEEKITELSGTFNIISFFLTT